MYTFEAVWVTSSGDRVLATARGLAGLRPLCDFVIAYAIARPNAALEVRRVQPFAVELKIHPHL